MQTVADIANYNTAKLNQNEFKLFSKWIHKEAGINLNDSKRNLVSSRLASRLRARNLKNYSEYFQIINNPTEAIERQYVIDLLTTNETYFFREENHFSFLQNQILPKLLNRKVDIWSAACSSGEEVWSIAITLKRCHRGLFSVFGTDINQDVLSKAACGIYHIERCRNLQDAVMQKYFLKGVNEHAGTIKVAPEIMNCCQFDSLNLLNTSQIKQQFDVVFLRNVMIYFDGATKQQVIDNVVPKIKSNGFLFVSHSENLNGMKHSLEQITPSVYQKVERGYMNG